METVNRAAARRARRYVSLRCLLALVAVLTLGSPPVSEAGDSRAADYQRLLDWSFSQPRPVAEAGLVIQLDEARVTLDEGSIRLQSPLADGRSYGLVFEGRGRLRMEVADEVELRQLRRFTRRPDLNVVEQEVTALVLATSDPTVFGALIGDGPYEPADLARERHEHRLRQELMDAASYVIEGISDPGGFFTRLDLHTGDWRWLSLTYVARRREEIELRRFHPGHKTIESWLSLDRKEDRRQNGRPSYDYQQAFDVPHVDIVADVRARARESPSEFSGVQPVRAKLRATVEIISAVEALTAVRLRLTPLAEVTAVTDAAGAPLEWIRDPIGKRWSSVDSDVHDDSLLVLLPEALVAGGATSLTVEYDLRLYGYAPGRSWYPGPDGPNPVILAPHTTTLEILHRANQSVRASGVLRAEEEGRSLWAHEQPVRMSSLVVVGKAYEAVHRLDGVPEVLTFSSLGGYMHEGRIEQVGIDVSTALDYFQQQFADPLVGPTFRSALIPSSHGQAFEAFLHVGDFTVARDNIATTTLFRAHEVAHQWWGHRVLWAGYRDQWLSEAFAEYGAMLFVRDVLEDGVKQFDQIVRAYSHQVLGSRKMAFSQYARPGYSPTNSLGLERIGPIGHGYRAYVGEAPSSYFLQTYLKGAIVLHMLHVLVDRMTGSDTTFIEILGTFIDRHGGSLASTGDFIAVVQEKVPADWSWFFDQWIYGSEVPTYEWSSKVVEGSETPFELRLRVEQKDVSPGFRMAVPVAITLSGGRTGTVLAFVDAPTKEFAFPLAERPTKVVFNPDYAVLARTRKK